jgi:hypothetical protein
MEPFSGSEAKVYSIIPEGENITLFEKFVDENKVVYKEEIKDILKRLKQIGHATGARESFFKHEGDNEFFRKYGKYVWALYDDEEKKLRLYCIRFTNVAIILGGGGYKDKSVLKWQDDENLSEEARKIIAYAEIILKQLDDGYLYWSNNGAELEGNLKNYGSGVAPLTLGINNSFRYKGIGVSFLIDGKFGGYLFSGTNAYAYRRGLSLETLAGRESGR